MSPSIPRLYVYLPFYYDHLRAYHVQLVQIAELLKRGWERTDIEGLTNKNLLRVMRGAENIAKKLQASGTEPSYEVYSKRTDLGKRREL